MRSLVSGALLLVLLTAGVAAGRSADWRHEDVWLKNEAGDRITPARNSHDPYSPKQTCGLCHGYRAITEGYHFRLGFNDPGNKKGPGPHRGMQTEELPLAAFPESVAAKVNHDLRRMGLPLYDWIALNGRFLPGGGLLEYGRTPTGLPDFSRTLNEAEAAGRTVLDGDFSSRLTPDGRSRFRASGVLEADCLICHQAGYRMKERNRQLELRNYGWAATAGSGLGRVEGVVFTPRGPVGHDADGVPSGAWNFSQRPVVIYRWRDRSLFSGDGRFSGALVRRTVSSGNCLQCHQLISAASRGSLYAPSCDAHARGGMQCTDCHPLRGGSARERLHHQVEQKKYTCAGCHLEGLYKPTRKGMPPAARDPLKIHAAKFPRGSFHFLIIRCEGCHITAQPLKGGYLLDEAAGRRFRYTADRLEAAFRLADLESPAQPWKPWITRFETEKSLGEQYVPYVPLVRQWFGERTPGGGLIPIRLAYVRQAAKKVRGLTAAEVKGTDGRKVRRETVAAKEEIATMLKALSSLGFRRAVFVSDRTYELKGGKVHSAVNPAGAGGPSYRLHHGVVPLKSGQTYGAKGGPEGCLDCHSDNAPFFTKMKVLNVGVFLKKDYPVPKEPNAEPQMSGWGLESVPSYE